LCLETGFKNIILPSLSEYGNPKDISDIYHEMKDQNKFKQLFKNLLTN
jgi:pentatricopeptide repeat protein